MECGDYMCWVLQTTNLITYVYGKSAGDAQILQIFMLKVSSRHFGETLSAPGLICYL